MLPLSTIEGQETEAVQTKPPEKGGETHMGWKPVGRWQWGGSPGHVCPQIPWASPEPALLGRQGQALSKPARSCQGAQIDPGSTCGVTMLPLSIIEDQETEEVQTKPPEKGALPSENRGEAPKKPPRKNARVSARRVPICPMPSVCFTFYMESNDSDFESQSSSETSKPGSKCTSPSKPRAKYREIKAWECPLCCLSILYLS
uniref:Uncharacterized protein n=1 Tax=Phocoena sinus TaxID=42100 RepID=A0A8C9C8I3_PHOSS